MFGGGPSKEYQNIRMKMAHDLESKKHSVNNQLTSLLGQQK